MIGIVNHRALCSADAFVTAHSRSAPSPSDRTAMPIPRPIFPRMVMDGMQGTMRWLTSGRNTIRLKVLIIGYTFGKTMLFVCAASVRVVFIRSISKVVHYRKRK